MRADRLLSIMMLLQVRGKMTTQALADELGVSRRTILRDLDALSFAGVPVYTDSGHGGGVSLDENYRTNLTGLNETEVRALFVAENLQLLSDIGLGDAARQTLQKLSAALPPEQQSIVKQVQQRIYMDPAWWWQDDAPLPFWEEIQHAVFEDRPIKGRYENYNGEIIERMIEPYSLVAKAGQWYLIAKREQLFRLYRITRFRSVEVLNARFQRDPEFNLVAFWHKHVQEFRETIAEYTCSLQIRPDQLNFVQGLMPGRFQITGTAENGWLTLRFQVESMDLAKMLVFGLSGQVVVLEPAELREAVCASARMLLKGAENEPRN